MKAVRLSHFLSWCLCAALLVGIGLPAYAQSVRSAISAEIEIAKIEGYSFPRQLAGLQRNGKTDYRIPGAGFSVSYGVPGETWFDIYIYDRQLDLPSGPALHLARKELESAIDDVHASIKAGGYQSVTLHGQSTSGPFAKAYLRITQGGRERNSVILVTVNNGNFVKIRLTSTGDADRFAQSLANEYSRFLSKSSKQKVL